MIASTKPSVLEMEAIAARHPHLVQSSSTKKLRPTLISAGVVLYMVFCWWFFSIGHVLANANWGIAGTYLADWVSYEIRPDIEIAPDGTMAVSYQRNSPLGQNPKPEWVALEKETVMRVVETPAAVAQTAEPKASSSFNFMASNAARGGSPSPAEEQDTATPRTEEVVTRAVVTYGRSTHIEVADKLVMVTHAGETFTMKLDGADTVTPQGPLPGWATQKRPGEKITLSFGLTGWAEVEGDEVSIRNRFFGWANFVFDTNSPFFGKSYGEVVTLILSGKRIDPMRSNLALAWNNILYNAEWQHLDVWSKLLQTVVMAFVGTLFASLAQHHAEPHHQPPRQALLRLSAVGRHVHLGALLHPRLRPRAARRHLGDLLYRHRNVRQALLRSPRKHRRQAARRRQIRRCGADGGSAFRRSAAGATCLCEPGALFLGIEHAFGHHHRRRGRRCAPIRIGKMSPTW
jgi:phosphonate transport system permease protein